MKPATLIIPMILLFGCGKDKDELYTFGGDELDCAFAVTEDQNGNAVFAGITESFQEGDFDENNGIEGWVAQVNGKKKGWEVVIGYFGNDYLNDIIMTSDGSFLAVGYSDHKDKDRADGWIVKIDSSGEFQWDAFIGDEEIWEEFNSITTDDNGNFLIAGNRQEPDMGKQGWIVKLNSSGGELWNQTYGETNSDSFNHIIPDKDYGFLACGMKNYQGEGTGEGWLMKINAFGTMEWEETYGGDDEDEFVSLVLKDNPFDLYICGNTYSAGLGSSDVWVMKLDGDYQYEWDYVYGTKKYEKSGKMTLASDGGLIITGQTKFEDPLYGNIRILKINRKGDIEWKKSFGDQEAVDQAFDVCVSSDGKIIVAGVTTSHSKGSFDAAIIFAQDNSVE